MRFLVGRADSFRTMLGEDYDLIGFDPRGYSPLLLNLPVSDNASFRM